jgi:RNA polymerase sigma factor (sigma-70 family)
MAGADLAEQPPDSELLERFLLQRDDAAFAGLVRRHGPMVFNVCRGVLRHEQDAEDAFQAVFLTLARNCGTIQRRNSVACWLHEVAYHVAIRAQRSAARRHAHERKAPPMAAADPLLDMTVRDLQRVLHEELRRLPDKYRVPLVLCYLEGRTHEEATSQLGWNKSTFRGRLDRGRAHLRRRLTQRGVALTAALCAVELALRPSAAMAALMASAVRAMSGTASANACALADGVRRAMFTSKIKAATALLLFVGLLTGAALAHQAFNPSPTPPAQSTTPKQQAHPVPPAKSKEDSELRTFTGRVIDTEGKSVAGAKLYLQSPWQANRILPAAKLQAATGADGRFEFRARPHSSAMLGMLVATAEGFGPNSVPADPKGELTVRLPKDDVPINGRVVDLQGQPVEGATIRVLHVQMSNNSPTYDDPTSFLKAARNQKDRSRQPEYQFFITFLRSEEIPTLPQSTRTDADGRFRLRGVGRERMLGVAIEGPTIATQEVRILTRAPAEGAERQAAAELSGMIYYYATFTHAAAPTQPITGVVRAKDTLKPIAGVRIWSQLPSYSYLGRSLVSTTTDAEGRYRLVGAPKGGENHIGASAGDAPFLTAIQGVPAGQGLEAVTVDFELKRGVWVQGRVIDKATKKPVSHVRIGYVAFDDNPHVKDAPPLLGPPLASSDESADDGAYRVLALSGPGMILLRSNDFATAYLSEPERDGGERAGYLKTRPTFEIPGNYNLMMRINPKDGTEVLQRDLALDPGETRKGTVLDPAGEPLGGTKAYRLTPWSGWEPQLNKSAEFTLRAFNPRRPRSVLFQHEARKLVGILDVPTDAATPMTVRMQPACSISGRLLDTDGQPRANVELEVSFLPPKREAWTHHLPNRISTDAQGRFSLGGLIPGLEYELSDRQNQIKIVGLTRPGESKDLGDVRAK